MMGAVLRCQGRTLPGGQRCDRASEFAVLRVDDGDGREVCELHLAEAIRAARKEMPYSYVEIGTPEA